MNKIFFAGAALAVLAGTPAAAQPGEGRGRLDQPQTRAAVAARVQARFAGADSNRDGFVTQEEVRARADARRADRREKRADRREQRFEQLDLDNDGMISRAEFEAPRARGGDRGERRAMRSQRREQRVARRGGRGMMTAGFGPRAFEAMDSNRDGRVALAEAQQIALRRFDRVDSNRDGTIGADERQSARAARMERREDRRAD